MTVRSFNSTAAGKTDRPTVNAIEKSSRPKPRKVFLTENEADLIDSIRSAGKKGRPIEKVIAKYGYQLED